MPGSVRHALRYSASIHSVTAEFRSSLRSSMIQCPVPLHASTFDLGCENHGFMRPAWVGSRDRWENGTVSCLRWSRLLGQVGGEVKLIPDVIMPPVWSSDHGGHAPHDLKHRSVHRPLPGFAPLDPSAVAACCSR